MKRVIGLLVVIMLIAAVFAAWNILGPTADAPADKYFYIKTGSSYTDVEQGLKKEQILSGTFFFDKIASQLKYKNKIKPGRYEIKENSSVLSLVRMLKSGNQSPVKLVINKLRTKQDLAGKIGKNFEADSALVISFLQEKDSLTPYGLDTNTVMTAIIPDTYEFLWNSSFKKIFGRLKTAEEKFWNAERKQKAAEKNLTPAQVYTMASIVEEETNKPEDKGLIASVYINRISRGEKLEADPTVKFAMGNFGLKRIRHSHLAFVSPYNTYRQAGLPPGPICTPSAKTIDAVLNAPKTAFMFFVAKPDFRGYSNFATTYAQHLIFAKAYQKALDSMIIRKQQNADTTN